MGDGLVLATPRKVWRGKVLQVRRAAPPHHPLYRGVGVGRGRAAVWQVRCGMACRSN